MNSLSVAIQGKDISGTELQVWRGRLLELGKLSAVRRDMAYSEETRRISVRLNNEIVGKDVTGPQLETALQALATGQSLGQLRSQIAASR